MNPRPTPRPPTRPALPLLAVLPALLLVATVLAGCGRRGPLEAPGAQAGVASPGPARGGAVRSDTVTTRVAPAVEGQANAPGRAQVDDAEEATADANADPLIPSPVPTPPRGRPRRGYAPPRDAFFLDPLL